MVATTYRLRTFVRETTPTFCAKALVGKPPKTGPTRVAMPSVRSPRVMVRPSVGRSQISPSASIPADDSVIRTSITMQRERIAAGWNSGAPKAKGVGSAASGAERRAEKSARPNGMAAKVPINSPISKATCLRKPRPNRWMTRMTASVKAASARYFIAPKSVAVLSPPCAQETGTGISVTPMSVMTTPVTSGGKNRSSRPKNGPTSRQNTPATSTAP